MALIDNIREDAIRFFENSNGCHDLDHTERVYNLCMHIGKIEGADLEILEIASLLHDIGREEETRSKGKICHAELSSRLAEDMLRKYDLDEVKISKISHCILTHRSRGKNIPESKEAKILFDADKLDSLGAVGIGRDFMFAGQIGARLHNHKIDVMNTAEYSKEDTAYREFMIKIRFLKDRMFTEEGKRIAKERHDYMEEFFSRMSRECDGEI